MEVSRLLCSVLLVILALGGCVESTAAVASLKLSAFNIRVFGVSKSEKDEVMAILSRVSGTRQWDFIICICATGIQYFVGKIFDILSKLPSPHTT